MLYYISKEEYRNYILLFSSLVFYALGEPLFVFVMMGSIILNYLLALWIDSPRCKHRKTVLYIAVIINLGLLFSYKYLDFFSINVSKIFGGKFDGFGMTLPIGISFFTFQALSYVIDVYRKEVNVQRNLFYVALYISFFPQLIAGPIVRYSTIESQIINRKFSWNQYGEGIRRFILGFCKKVIIANNLSNIVGSIFVNDIDLLSRNGVELWLGAACFSLQIFFDFSGYSDMAIGLGKMFGFEFLENFNYPYISRSITDFWRRWHISLSSWFRDYVYIPLGGSRVKPLRHIFNLLVVWGLTGLWHGANYTFVAWGLIYFVALVIEKYVIKPDKLSNLLLKTGYRLVTLLIVVLAWVIFNSPNLSYGVRYCARMLGLGTDVTWGITDVTLGFWSRYRFHILIGILFSMPICSSVEKYLGKVNILNKLVAVIRPIAYIGGFVWAVSYLVIGSHNPFIYYNF